MEGLEATVLRFVAEQVGAPFDRVRPETTLLGDLNIDGDDAVDLFDAFGREFAVDLSNLDLSRHFGPEGLPITFLLNWIAMAIRRGTHEERAGLEAITVADLVRAAEAKHWPTSPLVKP